MKGLGLVAYEGSDEEEVELIDSDDAGEQEGGTAEADVDITAAMSAHSRGIAAGSSDNTPAAETPQTRDGETPIETSAIVDDEDAGELPEELAQPVEGEVDAVVLENVTKFINARQQGQYLNKALRAQRGYRNPDFLSKMVSTYDIDEFGTNLPPEVFDPEELKRGMDYYELRRQAAREAEKRRLERDATQRIEYISSGVLQVPTAGLQLGGGAAASLAVTGGINVQNVVAAALSSQQRAAAARPSSGSKRKWDR